MQLIEITPDQHPELEEQVLIYNHEHRAFGGTSAGYRTMRSLEAKGILVCHDRRRPFYSLVKQ